MRAVLVAGPTATQNSPFLLTAVAETIASTHCVLHIVLKNTQSLQVKTKWKYMDTAKAHGKSREIDFEFLYEIRRKINRYAEASKTIYGGKDMVFAVSLFQTLATRSQTTCNEHYERWTS